MLQRPLETRVFLDGLVNQTKQWTQSYDVLLAEMRQQSDTPRLSKAPLH